MRQSDIVSQLPRSFSYNTSTRAYTGVRDAGDHFRAYMCPLYISCPRLIEICMDHFIGPPIQMLSKLQSLLIRTVKHVVFILDSIFTHGEAPKHVSVINLIN